MIRILAARELRSAFSTALGYVVVLAFLALFGAFFFFVADVLSAGVATVRPFFRFAPLLLVPLVPAVSMRLLAEERRSGTYEWLATLPITDTQLVLGKFLGGLGVVAVAAALSLSYPATVWWLSDGRLPLGPVATGYLGLLLLSATYLAAGLLVSCWTSNQIVAYLLGLVAVLFLWIVDKLAVVLPAPFQRLGWLGADGHFQPMAAGLVDGGDLAYFALLIGGLLAASVLSLQAGRLRA